MVPSFGPMQFAVGGSFSRTALWGRLGLGGLIIFRIRTRSRTHPG
jgi:ABC-2 type transport system permease protein